MALTKDAALAEAEKRCIYCDQPSTCTVKCIRCKEPVKLCGNCDDRKLCDYCSHMTDKDD